jgi:CheY-like chemotaxis protein
MASAPLILWAEDDPADQGLIRFAVEDLDPLPVIEFANDGLDLLDALKRIRPALVVLDIKMPRLGGIETLQAIKEDPVLKDLRVVVFTSGDRPEEVARCRALGAEHVLQKPMAFPVFRMLVHGIVSRIHNPRPAAAAAVPAKGTLDGQVPGLQG